MTDPIEIETPPPAYATFADWESQTTHLSDLELPEDGSPEAVERLLGRASLDIDTFLRFPPDPAAPPGTRIPPALLTPFEAWSLARACVEQAVYLLLQGEAEVREGRNQILSAAGVQFSSQPPDLIGAAAQAALAGLPLLWAHRSLCAEPEPVAVVVALNPLVPLPPAA